MNKLPQCMVNVRHSNLDSVLSLDSIKHEVETVQQKLGNTGRLVLRKSGTEPLIRVMVESECANTATDLSNHLADCIKAS